VFDAQAGDVYGPERNLPWEKASALEAAKANPITRQQLFIDQMEEYEDIDVDALSLLCRGLAVACHEARQIDAWAEAEAQADELRDMFLASGKSRRSTPRSELPSARSSEKGGSTPRTARRGSGGGGQW